MVEQNNQATPPNQPAPTPPQNNAVGAVPSQQQNNPTSNVRVAVDGRVLPDTNNGSVEQPVPVQQDAGPGTPQQQPLQPAAGNTQAQQAPNTGAAPVGATPPNGQ